MTWLATNVCSPCAFSYFEGLTYTEDRCNTCLKQSFELDVDSFVSLCEILSSLRVADDAVVYSDLLEHRYRYLSCICAGRLRVYILCSESDAASFECFAQLSELCERYEYATSSALLKILCL